MMAFLAAHPDAWSAADASAEPKARANDPALSALRVERDRLVADLARAQAAAAEASSDNPYAESPALKPDQLNARLREVDRALAARREALESAQPKASKLSPELRDEWQKLVKDVAQAPAAPPPPPPVRARVAQRAVTPDGPISPNRRLLVGLGSVLGLVVGGLGAALTLGAQKAARKRQSAPPGPRLAASSTPPPTKTILNSTLALDKPPEPIRPSSAAPKPAADTERAPANGSEPYRMSSSVPPNFQEALQGGNFKIPPARVPSISPAPIVPVAATPAKAFTPPPPAQVSASPIKPVAEGSPAAGSEPPVEAQKNGSEPAMAPAQVKSVPPPLNERKPAAVIAPAPEADALAAGPPRRETAAFEAPRADGAGARKAAPLESIHPPFTPPNDDRARLERKVRATPKTLVLGSVIAPVLPASRSTPPPAPPSSTKQNLRGTGYSHVSSNPPGADLELVQPRSVAPGWAPDPNVAPDSRRELCDKLFPLALERCFVIAVSGTPDSAESKSRVAAELAVSLAKSQHPRVLLLEGNRNRPAVHRLMRVDFAAEGLSRQLESRARGNAAPWTVKRCSETLDVLAEGLNRAPGMMLTPTFTTSVNELKGYYDFVVIDGPFLYDSADCKALAAVVDGVVLVCSDERARERVEQLSPFGVKRFQSVVPYSI